jgi:broad specificity phosphatase PhoE
MTTLLLVRHGESEANRANIFAGCLTDARLDEKGLEQAMMYARYAFDNYKIDKVFSSPLDRAYNTGKACADLLGIEVEKREGLLEIDGGEWEGMTLPDIKKNYTEQFYVWVNNISACRCVGGESVVEMGERFVAALRDIAEENDGKTVLIATHYTPIRAMQSYASTGSFEAMQDFAHIPNASITEVFYKDGKWSLGEKNIDSYLKGSNDPAPDILKADNRK